MTSTPSAEKMLLRWGEADNICPYEWSANFLQIVGTDILRRRVNAIRRCCLFTDAGFVI